MRTVILTLKDAVETGLKDIELLDKQDKVIFVYLKGKDSISIQVHTALAKLKCKVEFFEIPDENASKQDIPVYFAFLAGSSPNPVVIDTGSDFIKLSYLNIPRYPDFKSVFSKKPASSPSKAKRTRTQAAAIPAKPEQDSITKPPIKEKQTKKEVKPVKETKKEEEEKKDEKQAAVKPTRKSRPKPVQPSSGTATMDDLKAFLQENASEGFNPATMTMGIYEAVSKTVLGDTPITQALDESIIIHSKVEAINKALTGKWGKVTDIVTGILKGKGKI